MGERQALDALGRLLVTRVRDASLDEWLGVVNGTATAPQDRRLAAEIAERLTPEQRQLLNRWAVELIDISLHNVLAAIEEGERLKLLTLLVGEVDVVDASDGLPGELYGSAGWVRRFSKYPGARK